MSDIRKSSFILILAIAIFIYVSITTLSSDIVVAESEYPVVRGDRVTITVTILQNGSYGDPVQNQRIYYFDQTHNILLGYAISNYEGIASLDWLIPQSHPLGSMIINATFYGNTTLSLAPSHQSATLLILSETTIMINQIPSTLAPGDVLSFEIHLKDDSNSSVSDAQLTVLKDSYPLAIGTTNNSGWASFKIDCNSSWIDFGDNNIRVSFEQDLGNFLNSSEFQFTIEIAKIQTYLSFDTTFPNEFGLTNIIDLQMTLSDSSNVLPSEMLNVLLDDIHLDFLITNGSGQANYYTTIDARFSLGVHSLKIHFNGTERYTYTTLETTITITSDLILDTVVPSSAEIDQNVLIEFLVTDLLNRPIPDASIILEDTTSSQSFSIPVNDDTIIDFEYLLQGPSGIHFLAIDIQGNSFVTSNSMTTNFTAWSRPEIELLNTGINHYASPNQELSFEVRLTDWTGNCSARQLLLFIDDEVRSTITTDAVGLAIFTFIAPLQEASHNISIVYSGNTTKFELASNFHYNLFVTSFMPIELQLNSYEIVAALNELTVRFTVRGLNGTLFTGVNFVFNWLSQDSTTESIEQGLIILHLAIPASSGRYYLYYESESTNSIDSTQGSVEIEISLVDIMSTDGVGITGMIFAVTISIGIASVPILRRRYLVG